MKLPLVVNPQQIDPETLERLKVVDVRPLDDYRAGHLPGAVHLKTALLNRSEKAGDGLLPDSTGAKKLTDAIGLTADDHVLVYDAGGSSDAARLVWVLHAYGITAVSWLNGGIGAWVAATSTLSNEPVDVGDTDFEPSFAPGNMLTVDQLLASEQDAFTYLDVRSAGEYQGTDVRAQRGGHVPDAIHSEWTVAFKDDGSLKDDDELRALMAELKISHDQHVVVYCQTHQRSSLTYLVLKHLNYPNVSAIDGAWSVWGNRQDTPIDTPA